MTDTSGRGDTDSFLELFLADIPLIDTRAPVEFAKGSFPNAVNIPLMSDAEREQVGTCYKNQGQDAAIELGHRLVSGDTKQQRVAAWAEFARQHPEGYLYCFRGGLRSQICQQWMTEAEVPYPRITGGYKAMRRFLIDSIESISLNSQLLIVAGQTGCGKTEIMRGVPGTVDLEELAHHRGSAFGKRAGAQPTQIDFENAVAVELLRQYHRRAGYPIILEDESHLIGRCALPLALETAMKTTPMAVVEVSLEQRVEHTFANYILHKLTEWQQYAGTETGFKSFADDLTQSLDNIRRRLGGERHGQLSAILEQSLVEHLQGDGSLHREWIRPLLEEYYDPMYNYQLEKKTERIVFRGDDLQVREYLMHLEQQREDHA
ncbi:MAG: tRNA 2-selenouridine(34) synthase MnmH [Pseudomonadales bacterium]